MKLAEVVVTGMGVISPLGHDVDNMFARLLAGQSGISPITHFDTRGCPCSIGGAIEPFRARDFFSDRDTLRNTRVMDPVHQWALAASSMALRDAGLEEQLQPGASAPTPRLTVDRHRMGVFLGTGLAGRSDVENLGLQALDYLKGDIDWRERDPEELRAALSHRMVQQMNPMSFIRQCPSVAAAYIAMRYRAMGPNATMVSLCAAGAQALGEAAWVIARGDADLMLAGGADSMLNHTELSAFCKLDAVTGSSEQGQAACKPFDLRRDGCVVSEGAAMLVLERREHAIRRGARIYAELCGYGTTADAYKISAPSPDGQGAMMAMQAALRSGHLRPEEVGHINAHGTSTPLNDRIETHAIKRVFGDHATRIPIVSTKSMTGHLIAAAGAIEAVASIMAIAHQRVPPTINLEKPDPRCDLDYVPEGVRSVPGLQCVLSNSFAVGGVNASLIFRALP